MILRAGLIVVTVFSFLHLSNLPHLGVNVVNYTFKDIQSNDKYSPFHRMIHLPNSSFNEEQVHYLISELEKIHPTILTLLNNNNVKIQFFNGSLTDIANFNRLSGEKPRGYQNSSLTWDQVSGVSSSNIVYVKIPNQRIADTHSSVNLVLHEIGHAVDKYPFNYLRNNKEFYSIWKKESKQLFKNKSYFVDYPEEYFGEVFAMYYHNDESRRRLLEKAPFTFQFLTKIELMAKEKLETNTFNDYPYIVTSTVK